MLFTDVQRSVRLNKKKKSTNTFPYPDEVIDRLARAFYPAILACWNSEEGQREFAAWQAEKAHISGKEKQEVPAGELPALLIVCGFFRVRPIRGRTLFLFCTRLYSAHFVNVTAVSYRFLLPQVRTIRWRYPRRALPRPDERTSNRVQHHASA